MRSPCTLLLFDGQKTTIYPWTKARALEVVLNGPYLTTLHCHELIKICDWLKEHSEVHSVLLRSSNQFELFGQGPDINYLKNNVDDIIEMAALIYKLQIMMFHLPQIFICDLGLGAFNFSFEIALGAQIHLAHEDAEISMDHAKFGITPGQFSIKRFSGHPDLSFHLMLTGLKVNLKDVKFLTPVFYQKDQIQDQQKILNSIATLAPVARINIKLELAKNFNLLNHNFKIDEKLNLGKENNDWVEALKNWETNERPQFQTAKEYLNDLNKNKAEFNFNNILN